MAINSITEEKKTWYGSTYYQTTIAKNDGPIENKILAREVANTSERSQELASEKYHAQKENNEK